MSAHPRLGSDSKQTNVQIPPKSSLLAQEVLLGLLTGIWVRGYLQEHLGNRNYSNAKPNPVWMAASESWKPGAWCTANGSSAGGRVSFRGCEPLKQSEQSGSLSPLDKLVSPQSIWFIYPWGERILVNLFGFRDFLNLLNCLLPVPNVCPCWVGWSTST